MKKKHLVTSIMILMAATLILIITMQTFHLINSYNKTKEMLDRGISEAISRTLITLQKRDAVVFIYDQLNCQRQGADSIFPIDPYMSQLGLNPIFTQASGNGMEIQIHSYPGLSMDDFTSSFYSGLNNFTAIEAYMYQQFSESNMDFDQIVMQLETEFMQRQIPVEQRFNTEIVENILQKSLFSMGIDLDFEFAITDDKYNIKLGTDKFDIDRSTECYKFNMTPGTIFANPDILLVDFPDMKLYALKSIYAQLATSIFLTVLFIIVFGISLYALLKQKKLSVVKNDFINNMTHEFKTPIATIKLAAAAIKNEKTRANPAVMDNMIDIISQETDRMNHHVEQVLQIAVLDNQDLKISLKSENINDVILESINNIELVVSEKGGYIQTQLCTEAVILEIDRDLITNVMNNLLDNAIKYSKDYPEIIVTTYIKGDKFQVSIEDKGIGISKDTQNKVFDRFYRASTGNIHNIKGFGLGLNYAQQIVHLHKGLISVKSTIEKGSTFTISLALAKQNT